MRLKERDLMLRTCKLHLVLIIEFHCRTIRHNKLLNFTKPGFPGVKFKNHFEKMIKGLTLPKSVKEELRITDDAGQHVFSSKAGS